MKSTPKHLGRSIFILPQAPVSAHVWDYLLLMRYYEYSRAFMIHTANCGGMENQTQIQESINTMDMRFPVTLVQMMTMALIFSHLAYN